MIRNKSLNRRLCKLAIPIIILNLLSTAIGAANSLMLNAVGQTQLSALSLACFCSDNLFHALRCIPRRRRYALWSENRRYRHVDAGSPGESCRLCAEIKAADCFYYSQRR